MTLTRHSTTPGKIRVAVFGRFGKAGDGSMFMLKYGALVCKDLVRSSYLGATCLALEDQVFVFAEEEN
jgi:hypothetical protein